MTDWTATLQRALDSRATAVEMFFRDDDAGWADDRLFALLDVFAAYACPIDLAAIPMAVGSRLAGALLDRKRRGDAVGVHQHGFMHRNNEIAAAPCSSGPTRSAAAQSRDIARATPSPGVVRRAPRSDLHPAVESLHRDHRAGAARARHRDALAKSDRGAAEHPPAGRVPDPHRLAGEGQGAAHSLLRRVVGDRTPRGRRVHADRDHVHHAEMETTTSRPARRSSNRDQPSQGPRHR